MFDALSRAERLWGQPTSVVLNSVTFFLLIQRQVAANVGSCTFKPNCNLETVALTQENLNVQTIRSFMEFPLCFVNDIISQCNMNMTGLKDVEETDCKTKISRNNGNTNVCTSTLAQAAARYQGLKCIRDNPKSAENLKACGSKAFEGYLTGAQLPNETKEAKFYRYAMCMEHCALGYDTIKEQCGIKDACSYLGAQLPSQCAIPLPYDCINNDSSNIHENSAHTIKKQTLQRSITMMAALVLAFRNKLIF